MRPIGTQIKIGDVDLGSTRGTVDVITWEIVGYAQVDDFGLIRTAETVKCVDIAHFPIKRITLNTYKLIELKRLKRKLRTKNV